MFGSGIDFISNEHLGLWLVLLAFACIVPVEGSEKNMAP